MVGFSPWACPHHGWPVPLRSCWEHVYSLRRLPHMLIRIPRVQAYLSVHTSASSWTILDIHVHTHIWTRVFLHTQFTYRRSYTHAHLHTCTRDTTCRQVFSEDLVSSVGHPSTHSHMHVLTQTQIVLCTHLLSTSWMVSGSCACLVSGSRRAVQAASRVIPP